MELVFEREVDSDLEFPDADLIIASDGINSKIRNRYADAFKPDMVMRPNRFIWLGSKKPFDAFTFDFRKHRARLVPGAHLQVRRRDLDLHRRDDGGRVRGARPRQARSGRARSPSAKNFSPKTLDGAKLMTNARHLRGSAWLNFSRLICGKWSHFNGKNHVVLMGDAAHTAHFAIGSGTKLALDDAIELTPAVRNRLATPDEAIPEVLAAYEEVRARRRRAHPECGAQRDGMVRGRRQPLRRHARARAVHVFDADALAAHQPRESAAARQGVAGRL